MQKSCWVKSTTRGEQNNKYAASTGQPNKRPLLTRRTAANRLPTHIGIWRCRDYLNKMDYKHEFNLCSERLLFTCKVPFKSLGSLRNVLVFERKAFFFKHNIDQKYSVDIVYFLRQIFYGISTKAYRHPLSAIITPVFQWHVVLANPSLSF